MAKNLNLEEGLPSAQFGRRRFKRSKKFTCNDIGSLMGLLLLAIIICWSLYMSLFSARVMDDINHQLDLWNATAQKQDDLLLLHKKNYVNLKKILLIGLLASPMDLYVDRSVLESIEKLCSAYQSEKNGKEGFVDVQILYQEEQYIQSRSVVSILKDKLESSGCRIQFVAEEGLLQSDKPDSPFAQDIAKLSRYKKIARLRSLQRRSILSQASASDYDVVVNIDLDIVEFPPIHSTIEAIGTVAKAAEEKKEAIVCANGYETLTVASLFRRKLYYDTFAAIDINGDWYYTEYAASLWQMLTFGQTNLFRDILHQYPALWPMQTCFGGLAIYDFQSWSNKDCDYDQNSIKLKRTEKDREKMTVFERQIRQRFENKGFWKIPPQYTIDLSPDGDVCEHVVFQQCLIASALARDKPVPTVGVQPNLLIGRESAILTRREDKVNFAKKMLFVLALLYGSSVLVKYVRDRIGRSPKRLRRLSVNSHYHNA